MFRSSARSQKADEIGLAMATRQSINLQPASCLETLDLRSATRSRFSSHTHQGRLQKYRQAHDAAAASLVPGVQLNMFGHESAKAIAIPMPPPPPPPPPSPPPTPMLSDPHFLSPYSPRSRRLGLAARIRRNSTTTQGPRAPANARYREPADRTFTSSAPIALSASRRVRKARDFSAGVVGASTTRHPELQCPQQQVVADNIPSEYPRRRSTDSRRESLITNNIERACQEHILAKVPNFTAHLAVLGVAPAPCLDTSTFTAYVRRRARIHPLLIRACAQTALCQRRRDMSPISSRNSITESLVLETRLCRKVARRR